MPRISLSVTTGFIGLLVVSFVVSWLFQDATLFKLLSFSTLTAGSQPWTFLTYPFDGSIGIFGILCAAIWMSSVGGQVEQDLTAPKYLAVILAFVALCPLFVLLGSLIMGETGYMFGPLVVIECVTIMWATRAPLAVVKVFGILPVQARWLGVLGAAFIFFSAPPKIAPFLLIPLGLIWAFADNRLPIRYGKPRGKTPTETYRKHWKEDENYFSDVKRREKEREERERLRKLFEGSIKDDEK